jgi:hypothetical protein
VVKVVNNNSGGTAAPDDFSLTLGGDPVLSGVAVDVNPGTYEAGETQLAGYTFAGFSGDCGDDGKTTVALGDHKTCTLTNNDDQATITVIKEVINDNGGLAGPNDFGLMLDGSGTTSGTPVDVDPGTHTAAEAGLAGYTFTGFSGDCDTNGDITIALGQSLTCTLTNNDQAATLVVIKHVINDNGGTAVASDFTLDSGGTNDSPDDFAGDELGTTVSLDAGSYGVTETGPPGYTRSDSADCSGTIALGETKTCTVTNDDQAATLIVKKVVINDNGGTKLAQDFSFQVNGGSAIAFEADAQNDYLVGAGTYNVIEPAVEGYTTTYDNCSNIVLANGGTATCTVTNDDIKQVQAQITPTATTCQQFRDGTSATLAALNYSVKTNGVTTISQVDPGVFFYWIKVDAVAGANSFTIAQDITSANFGTYFAKAAGSALWTSSCTKVNSASITQSGYPTDGDVTVTFNASSAGTYIIGIKYDSGSVKGVAPPTGTGIAHYTFSVSGTGIQGLDLKPKP